MCWGAIQGLWRAASALATEPLLSFVLVGILKVLTKYNFSVNFIANKSVFEHMTGMCKYFTLWISLHAGFRETV